MPEEEVAEILLEADENIVSLDQISQRLEDNISNTSISMDIRRIAESVGSNYNNWVHRSGRYHVEEIQSYSESLRDEYNLDGNPDRVLQELDRLGVLQD